jgi:NADH:ubiquinone oxidoreductase subunit 5 (subunit L)/multisubunit Na+/H+ antiporter MnhA subunit
METRLLFVLLTPFALALLMPWLGGKLGPRTGWVALLAPVLSFLGILGIYLLPGAERVAVSFDWVPSLGVALTFNPDGLALFFGFVVSGVGVLVAFYSACYLDDHYKDHGRFYCYLLLFMGAMLGTVFSSNLLGLFVSWELTGITSFLLIGFLHDKPESQRGARMALLTTCFTGLALLAGVLLLGSAYGTFELAEILAAPGVLPGKEGVLLAAFFCCFAGICGKSAQFPFHYWLPNAMAAPTPVSAYLHSATMVKLGVFLTARLLPVFNGLESWLPVLTMVGFGTLALGALLALLSQDLKAVLAYTTVAQLGLLIGHYGLYTQGVPLAWDYLHIINHVFYKACLFMVVGIIDHSTGTRDLRKLGGLFSKMPLTGVAALITLAAMAGLPPTTGFLSKEMLLEAVNHFRGEHAGWFAWWPITAVVAASTLLVAVSLNVFHRAFLGKPSHEVEEHFHAPSVFLQLPPLLLAAAALVFGVMAEPFGRFLDTFAQAGIHAAVPKELHLWHGITTPLLISAGIVAAGAALYFSRGREAWGRAAIPGWLLFDRGFDRLIDAVPAAGKKVNKWMGFGNPHVFLFVILAAVLVALGAVVVPNFDQLPALASQWDVWPREHTGWIRWAVVAVIGWAAVSAVRWKQPIRQLFALSVIGMGIVFYYVLYQAPDLALTQMMVETATLLLVLLVVLRFKRDGDDMEELPAPGRLSRAAKLALSAGMGLAMGGGVLVFQQPHALEWAGDYYLANTVALAHGHNSVNTVVVDFRGWDTMLEIAVLVIAALGCLGLLSRPPTGPARAYRSRDLFPVPRDPILRTVAVLGFVPLNLFAAYIFFRGHNAAGGGFIAGLFTALSLLLLTFAVGVTAVRTAMKFNAMTVAAAGVIIALATALLPLVYGLPILNHLHGDIAGVYVGTPMLFDLGVYLTVIGVTLKIMLPLMKSVHGMPSFVAQEEGRFAAKGHEPINFQNDNDADEPMKEGKS